MREDAGRFTAVFSTSLCFAVDESVAPVSCGDSRRFPCVSDGQQTTVEESPPQITDMKCEIIAGCCSEGKQFLSLFLQILHYPALLSIRYIDN